MIQQFIIDVLLSIYSFAGNLGLAIIIFTILVRTILTPLTMPSLKAAKQMKDLQPELKKLKQKHKDKQALQLAQMELYKKYNVNPLAGCLPQIVQLVLLIVLYQALTTFLGNAEVNGVTIASDFFGLELTQPDGSYTIPVLAGLTQLILSLMISPGAEIRDVVPNNSKNKKVRAANEKEEDMAEMAQQMQQQMVFLMPIMTGFIATRFPAGLGLYWITTTVFSIAQQYIVSGPGGLVVYWQRLKNTLNRK